VKRDQRRDRRKYREQAEEHYAGGDSQQPVFVDLFIGTPQNLLPSLPRHLERVGGMVPLSGLRYGRPQGAAASDFRNRESGGCFSGRVPLKIALRGQDQDRGSRDQKQTIGVLGPAGHHTSIRRASCRRLTAAQPNKVAIRIRAAGTAVLSRVSRCLPLNRLRLARVAGDGGADGIAGAVSLVASI